MPIDVAVSMVIGVLDSIKATNTTPTDVEASIIAISIVNRIIAGNSAFEDGSSVLI